MSFGRQQPKILLQQEKLLLSQNYEDSLIHLLKKWLRPVSEQGTNVNTIFLMCRLSGLALMYRLYFSLPLQIRTFHTEDQQANLDIYAAEQRIHRKCKAIFSKKRLVSIFHC